MDLETKVHTEIKKVLANREEILKAFITKYGYEPDKIRQIEKHNADGSITFHIEHIEEPMNSHNNCSCPVCVPPKYELNKIASEKSMNIYNYDGISEKCKNPECCEQEKEIKLEVGKKYNFLNKKDVWQYDLQPFELIYQNEYECVFKDRNNRVVVIPVGNLFNFEITEHREMIKNSVEGWINCDPEKKPDSDPLDRLTNFYCDPKFYERKIDAIHNMGSLDCKKQIYGRLTFEQLPEPQEKKDE